MGPDAIPTPFDINPIPYFAFSPGTREWLALLTIALCAFALVKLRQFFARSSRTGLKAIAIAMGELSALLMERAAPAQLLSKASLTLRRILSQSSKTDFSSMSRRELEAQLAALPAAAGREVIPVLVKLESRRYDPGLSQDEAGVLLKEALAALDAYRSALLTSERGQRRKK
jgi:hypothetical protein